MTMPSKPSLVKAVTDVVKIEFVGNNVIFSAHDVTTRLRDLVSMGSGLALDSNESGVVSVQGNFVPRIVHDDVRDIIHALFDAGEFPTYSRESVGSHLQYAPEPVAIAPTSPDPVQSSAPVSSGPWSVIP